MRDTEINEMQQKVIDARGVVRVDAGPGTGKTETIANRYLKLIESGVEPDDILLITFTRNGSKEMLQRLSSKLGPDNNLIDDMRVSTFDALSNKIIHQSTESISRFFGIQDLLFKDSMLVENESSNKTYFKRTLDRMRGADSSNPYFELLYTDWADLYYTINRLMNFGIFPQQEGWFGFNAKNADGTSNLYGGSEIEKTLSNLKKDDIKKMLKKLEKMEADSRYHLPRDLVLDGTLNPRFFPQISGIRPDEPDDDYDSTMKDRNLQISFIHDVYLNYIQRSIENNRLTFGLVAMFALVVLYENKDVRQSFGSKYIMIDEFQDTNCNQLMTSLMLLKDRGDKQAQLCMVGDFRQSIFGFRDATPEYFKEFSDRIGDFVDFLGDRVSVEITLSEENNIVLNQNYRSSQEIIDFSYAAFESSTGEATESVYDSEQPSKIEMVKVNGKEDHIGEVIARIRNYYKNEDYPIRGFDVNGDRISSPPDYGDIAVLCRSNKRAYQIAERLSDQGFPVFLNSDVELMNTREGKTILAWLRYLEDPEDKRSIGPILVEQGYHRESVLEILKNPSKVPETISGFREELSEKKDHPLKIVAAIANQFDYLDAEIVSAISDVLLTEYEDSGCTVSELIDFIEKNISDSGKFTIDKPMDSKSIVVETIHKAKGSEFPIVIIPFMYDSAFPFKGSHKEPKYSFSENTGLRSAHELVTKGDEVYLQRSWKYELASEAESISNSEAESIPNSDNTRDEESRLLFVALSRSKQYITTIANEEHITFHKRLFKSEYASAPLNRYDAKAQYTQSSHYVPYQNFPTGSSSQWVGVYDVIDQTTDRCIDDSETESLGIEYGLELHRAAKLLIQDPSFDCDELDLKEDDVEVLRDIIKNLTDNGFELKSEVDCKLPFPDEHIVLHGIMDLFAIREENGRVEIQIHDWKTDNNTAVRRNGYEQQVSIYYCAVKKCYPDAEISCYLDYIRARPEDPVVKVEIRNTEEIDGLVKNYLRRE